VILFQTVELPWLSQIGAERGEDAACQVALQATDDLHLPEAFRSVLAVSARTRVVAQAHHDCHLQLTVCGAIAATVTATFARSRCRW